MSPIKLIKINEKQKQTIKVLLEQFEIHMQKFKLYTYPISYTKISWKYMRVSVKCIIIKL